MHNNDNMPGNHLILPASPQVISAREMRRRFGYTVVVAAVGCLFFGIALALAGQWWPLGFCDAALCVVFLALRRWALAPAGAERMEAGIHVLAFISVSVLFLHVLLSGMAASFAVWYYAVVPISVAVLGNSRVLISWSLAALFFVTLTFLVQEYMPITPSLVLTPMLWLFAQIMLVLIATFYSIAALRANQGHLDNLHTAFETLLAQRNLLDEQARKLNESLRDAEEARAIADAANAAKSEFLAMMSHEIRTPLNGVIGLNSLLLDQSLDEKSRRYALLARQSGDALLELINDFLDFSRMEAGGLVLERVPFSPRCVVDEAMNIIVEGARNAGLALACDLDVPAAVVGDPARLRQILLNLLGNAVKFTAQGEIRLVARQLPGAGAQVRLRFEVRDTGIGIDADAQQRLFQPFIQADASTTRRFGGTGLGLAICRALALRMGGQIGVESVSGQGSTFWVELPFALPEPGAVVLPVENGLPSRQRFSGRVLVAEDNPVNQMVAREMIERLGLAVDVVGDGELALHAVSNNDYDLVLMDCHMPVVDGYDATRAIRKLAGPRNGVKIVAMTAGVLAGDEDKCRAAGMDGFMAKPLRLTELEKALGRWLPAG